MTKTLKIKKPSLPTGKPPPPNISEKKQDNNTSLKKKPALKTNNLEPQPNKQVKNTQKVNFKNKIERVKKINKLIRKPKLLLLEEDNDKKSNTITQAK